MSQLRIAVDSGGTFTDVVAELGGRCFVGKVASTPDNPARGVRQAIHAARAYFDGVLPESLVHGTTVATNTLLQRNGARVALITNAGLSDLLDIDRQNRAEHELYSLRPTARPQLVALNDRYTIDARRDASLALLSPLDRTALATALAKLDDEPRSWAICLLHSYGAPDDELEVARLIGQLRGREPVTTSAHVLREAREVERFHTAVANAHVQPVMQAYLEQLGDLAQRVEVMSSAGGRLRIATASELPVLTALSGPAGGVVAAAELARRFGYNGVISLDMGGTSTDVCMCVGEIPLRRGAHIGDFSIHTPMLDVHTVGAGGGSITYVDSSGALRVGPQSAGAQPGPACYGTGELPTVTDADVLLGRLPATTQLGGFLAIQESRSRAALETLCTTTQLSVESVAEGVVSIVDEAMAAAVRKISIEKGLDPREYPLCVFGGAGGLHGCGVAEKLQQTTVIVPGQAGVFSARGMLLSTPASDLTQTATCVSTSELEAARALLLREAIDRLGSDAVEQRAWLSMRYGQQGHTLEVAFDDDVETAERAFVEAHQRRFGYGLAMNVVADTLRVRVSSAPPAPFETMPLRTRSLIGPISIVFDTHTVFVERGWSAEQYDDNTVVMYRHDVTADTGADNTQQQTDSAVQLALFRYRFEAIAEEMGDVLMRAAFSPNIRERRDHSCAIFDCDCAMIAQAAHIPVHLGAAPLCVRFVRDTLTLADGETAIVNDPFSGGTHLPDITLVTAVDIEGRRYWVASRAHHADVGGVAPGSLPLSRTVDDEGWRCAPTLLSNEVVASLYAASRTPLERRGDLDAQVAANRRGMLLLRELAALYGAETIAVMAARLLDAGAVAAQSLLRTLPRRTVVASDHMCDVAPGVPVATLRLTLTVSDRIAFDFSATDAQVEGPFNATRAIVESAVFYAMRCLLPRDVPTCSGVVSGVDVITLPGTLVDAVSPAAVAAGNVETSQRLVDLILCAFSQLLPGAIPASSYGSMNNVLIGSLPGSEAPFAYYETIGGGHGAHQAGRGADAMQAHMTNTRNTPIEVLEQSWPLRVVEYSVRRGSGGDGLHCGGDGIVREFELLAPAHITVLAERRREGAPGLDGGASGSPGLDTLTRPQSGVPQVLPGGKASVEAPAGTRLRIETPGGGGWGEPR